jgi:hypothetical protein
MPVPLPLALIIVSGDAFLLVTVTATHDGPLLTTQYTQKYVKSAVFSMVRTQTRETVDSHCSTAHHLHGSTQHHPRAAPNATSSGPQARTAPTKAIGVQRRLCRHAAPYAQRDDVVVAEPHRRAL